MSKRYVDDWLYCLKCTDQPEYFYEVLAWQVNQVTADGTFVRVKDSEVMEYQCWNCQSTAQWGWRLNKEPERAVR